MFRVYLRSVLGSNRPSGVRPDSVNLYLQLDNYKDSFEDKKRKDKYVKAKCNVTLNSFSSSDDIIYVSAPYKGVYDSYVSTENHEDAKSASVEDGRSRRYFISLDSNFPMISVDILQSHLPIKISRINQKFDFGTFLVETVRFYEFNKNIFEVRYLFLGGKNTPDYVKYSITDFTTSISEYMHAAENIYNQMVKNFHSLTACKTFVLMLGYDHSAKIDSIDIDSFLERFGLKWSMPPKSALFSDPISQTGFLGIHGIRTPMRELKVDILMHDYDDHSPSLYTITNKFFFPISPSVERRMSANYYIDRKMSLGNTYARHDGSKMTESEYQSWRVKNRIRW